MRSRAFTTCDAAGCSMPCSALKGHTVSLRQVLLQPLLEFCNPLVPCIYLSLKADDCLVPLVQTLGQGNHDVPLLQKKLLIPQHLHFVLLLSRALSFQLSPGQGGLRRASLLRVPKELGELGSDQAQLLLKLQVLSFLLLQLVAMLL